jgi:hypothetical protein
MWASIQSLLPQMKKIAGKHNFAIISTPKVRVIGNNASAYQEGYRLSYITTALDVRANEEQKIVTNPDYAPLMEPQDSVTEAEVDRVMRETNNKYSREFVRFNILMADYESKEETSKFKSSALELGDTDYTDVSESGKKIGISYIYASSSRFRDLVGIDGVDRGATLLTTGDELKQLYENPNGLNDYLEGVKFVFVDNITPGLSSPLDGPNRVLIRLPAMENGAYADIIGLTHGNQKKRFTVFSLLPETVEDAKPWSLDEHLTRSYVAAGKTIAKELKRSGLERGAWSSAQTLASAVEQAVKDGSNPILVGESAEDGRVRMAGLSEPFDPEILSEAARRASYFIFCNSSNGQANREGFSIEGKIYVNAVAELLGTFAADQKTENSREHFSAANEWLRSIIEALTSENAAEGTKTVDVYRYIGRPIPPPPPPPNNELRIVDNEVPYMLFLFGAFGGVCSEFFRWRALLKRPRGPQFKTPTYIILSCIFVLLAGGVGYVFGRLAPTDLLQTIAAFIAGAGLEEVIKRASRLKSPNVPFDKSSVKASLHEFLSG